MSIDSVSVAPDAALLGGARAQPDRVRTRVMLACVIGNMLSFTPVVRITFGVFLLPMAHEFHWPRARLSGAMTVTAFLTAAIYPILGRVADRLGPRRLIVWGSMALGLTILALALARPNVLVFYTLFAAAGIAGALPSSVVMNRLVSEWFDKTRGVMLGVSGGLGNGAGASLMPIVAAVLMSFFGWRGAYLGLGALVLLVAFPTMALMLREAPRAAPSAALAPNACAGLNLGQAARTPAFWVTLLAIALAGGCISAAASHIIPILSDRGLGLALGAAVISTYALVCAAGQVLIGGLLDRTRSPRIAAPLFLAAVAGLVLLEHTSSRPLLLGAGVLLGIGLGAEYSILPYAISRYFGMKHFGSIAGVMYATLMLAQGVTPFLMDLDYDAHKSYVLALHIVQAGLVAASVMLMTLRPYPMASAASARAGSR
jgi:MFS family permease